MHRSQPSRLFFSWFTGFFCAALALALTAAAQQQSVPVPQLKVEKYSLPNGLEVILAEDHRLPLVAVNLWYHVGPANERAGRTGFAHLFEHMMFEGSEHTGPKSHNRYLEAAGASDINGSTDFDRTNYFETLPSNQLELALWLESDRMGYLLGTLDREKLVNQRDVVRNERRQTTENEPYGLVEEDLYHQLFPKDHPYHADVIGSHEDIEAARLNDVREFFRQYYTPNNCSMVIAGDIDPTKTKTLVQKYFGSIPSGPPVPPITASAPVITSEKRSVVTDQVELPKIYIGWIAPTAFQPGDAESILLAELLGGGKSSRLYKKLVYEKQIAQDVSVTDQSLRLGSVFEIQATARPGVKIEDLEKAINDELNSIQTDGPAQAELDRARNLIQTHLIVGVEGYGARADRLNLYNQYLQDPNYLAKDLERYDRASVADLKRVAADVLRPSARAVAYGLPGKKVIDDPARASAEADKDTAMKALAGTMPDESWRAKPPAAGPPSRLALPVAASFKLPNGLTVLHVEQHQFPLVVAELVVLGGAGTNPIDKPGLSSFTAQMLSEGTERRSSTQIADDVAQIGASLRNDSVADSSSIYLRTLAPNREAALDLLSDVALHPKFDPTEMERVRKERQTDILQIQDDPFQVAFGVLVKTIYGPAHPYGYRNLGTETSNSALTRDDLVASWRANYTPANSALVLVGDLTPADAHSLAEKYFGSWQGSTQKQPPAAIKLQPARGIYLVDKPGAPQTMVLVGSAGASRSTPDYVPLEVMNNVLGGLFSSRLNMNLREEHGYTYGGFSFFDYRRGPGIFLAGGGIRTDSTVPAVEQVFKELDRIRTSPPSPEELKLGKGAFSLSLAGFFESSGQTAGTIGDLFVFDLPLNYYQQLPGKIDAVSTEDVQRVAQRYVHPENAIVVGVGDNAKVADGLGKLALGPVTLRDYDGNPLKTTTAAAPTK
jgi:zinc protease